MPKNLMIRGTRVICRNAPTSPDVLVIWTIESPLLSPSLSKNLKQKKKFEHDEFLLQWGCHPSFVTADLFHFWKESPNGHIGCASVKPQNNWTNTLFWSVFQLLWTLFWYSIIWKRQQNIFPNYSQTLGREANFERKQCENRMFSQTKVATVSREG